MKTQSQPTDFKRTDIEGWIPSRFRKIVDRRSPCPAIVSDDGKVTSYAELDLRSNQVANAILAGDTSRSSPIPLLFGHDARAITALLGVLKAGRSYALLDPKNPPQKNRGILDHLGAEVLIHSDEMAVQALDAATENIRLLEIDAIISGDRYSTEDPQLDGSPDDLAFIVFTSGSTGVPKGVMQNHRNVLHRAWTYSTTASLTADDRLVLFYSPSASGAVRDIFGSLMTGCALYVYDIRKRGFDGLADWLRAQKITVYNSVATVFRHFVRTLTDKDQLPDLRLVQLGSETIYRSDAELYKRLLPDTCGFVARLGSSEMSPICKYAIDKSAVIEFPTVPAGYAVDGVGIDIIDEDGVSLPPGKTGEIVVTSRYLTPGYWRQPELNEALFDPSPEDPSERRFRTGDLGMITDGGYLVHMGRKDFQVKISGFRVEPAEVESALLDLVSVREAAVMAMPGPSDEYRLVAYVVGEKGYELTTHGLRDALREKLPAHMIPSHFEFLESLPTNSTGKVDRLALPWPLTEQSSNGYLPPSTRFEEGISNIFASILGLEKISMTDRFVDLGGTSLTAMQVISAVNSRFDVRLPLHTVFEEPSLAELAKRVELSVWLKESRHEPAPDEDSDREEGVL